MRKPKIYVIVTPEIPACTTMLRNQIATAWNRLWLIGEQGTDRTVIGWFNDLLGLNAVFNNISYFIYNHITAASSSSHMFPGFLTPILHTAYFPSNWLLFHTDYSELLGLGLETDQTARMRWLFSIYTGRKCLTAYFRRGPFIYNGLPSINFWVKIETCHSLTSQFNWNPFRWTHVSYKWFKQWFRRFKVADISWHFLFSRICITKVNRKLKLRFSVVTTKIYK